MDGTNLRNLASQLRTFVAVADQSRREKAAQVIDAAVALHKLQQKVRRNG